MFRGYIRSNGKSSIDKFKDCDVLSFEAVRNHPSYGGVLAKETVLIDVDTMSDAEKLYRLVVDRDLKCVVSRTNNGMHFYFKNDGTFLKCGTEVPLACGIKADIKTGVTNCYAVLKKNGVEREIIRDEGLGEAPFYLRVVKSRKDMSGAEGRNNSLFSYILPLQKAKFTKEQIVEILKIINEYVFDEPLSDEEFATVTRDESFETAVTPEFYGERGMLLFDVFAEWLVREKHIKRINGQLHIYEDGVYKLDQTGAFSRIQKEMIKVIPRLSANHRNEVLKYIELICGEDTQMSGCNLIAFANGVLDIETMQLMDFSPDIVITNKIGWDYKAVTEPNVVDKVLSKVACGDKDIVSLLEEVAGYTLFRRNELRRSILLLGDKANGKSSYINMLSRMLGNENISALDLKDVGAKFLTAELAGKLANLGDDIGEAYIDDSSVFKKLVSGDKVMVEHKGEKPFFFTCYAKFIFSANTLPRIRDRSGAVLDRLVIVPFNATFRVTDADFDPFISDKLKTREAIERLIWLGVEGLKRVLKAREFTKSSAVEKAKTEYAEENNPILVFMKDWDEDRLCREAIAEVYGEYVEFCVGYGCTPMSRIAFTKFIQKEYPDLEVKVVKVGGKSVRRLTKTGLF